MKLTDPLEIWKWQIEHDMLADRPVRRRIPTPEEIEGDYLRGRERAAEKESRDE